ncbi:MAG TPA: oligogalacturonate lyase family protein, partial [Bacillales bacterium]|nr:oligogalacturonate lyase family protein [Bacillales bacterium]
MTTAGKGKVWPTEWQKFDDPTTGVSVWQLTNYFAHSFHIYFTNNGWYDNGNKLLFGSDRWNAANLYSLDLENGSMTQLTDHDRNDGVGLQETFINPKKQEAYFTKDNKVVALDLQTYEERTLYEAPKGYNLGNVSCTADGLSVCTAIKEDLSDRIPTNLGAGYGGFEETAKAHPHCQILSIPVAGGEAKLLHEEKTWIGHVNTSPTQPHLLSLCHEGPWHLVDHRIWCLDLNSG